MPNKRADGIINISFTMPAKMAEMLDARAKSELTNKSEIVRRAIMRYLTPEELAAIRSSVLNDAPNPNAPKSKGPVKYPKKGGQS